MTKPGPVPPGTPTTPAKGGPETPRAERLAAALRANLRRRKAQKQERDRAAEAGSEADDRPGTGSVKES